MAMFPFKWSDGTWRNGPEPREQSNNVTLKPRQPWTRRGAFTTRPMSPYRTRLRCEETRDWLYFLLRTGPKPAKEVYRLAKAEGLSVMGVRRAKRHHGIRTIKTGGRQHGYGAQWIWHFPSE